METNEQMKLFEDKAFIKIEGPVIAGWHDCQFKELLATQDEKYEGQLDGQLIKWVGKPIPKDIMADVLALVKHYPRMEVQICLYYNSKEGQWLAHVPKQKGTPAHVSYNDEEYVPPKGYYFTGTIHTHPNMGAFWSGTDTNDQTKKTGLHIVLGLKEGVLDNFLVSVFFNGVRYDQDKSVVEIPDLNELPEAKKEWLDAVEEVYEPEVVKDLNKDLIKPTSEYVDMYRKYLAGAPKKGSSMWGLADDPGWEYDEDGWPYAASSISSRADKHGVLMDVFDTLMQHCSDDEIYEAAAEMMEAIGETSIADTIKEARLEDRESNSKCSISM